MVGPIDEGMTAMDERVCHEKLPGDRRHTMPQPRGEMPHQLGGSGGGKGEGKARMTAL